MNSIFPKDRKAKRNALLEAVESVRHVVEKSALEAEELRTLPRNTVDAIYDAGLFSLKVPEVLGGAEADIVTQMEVVEAMTRIDTSAGWTLMIGAGALGLASAFVSDEAISEIFAAGRIPRFASSSRPMGKAVPANGGYVVNGRWPFASGILHSEWVLAGVPVAEDAANGGRRIIVFPTSKAEIHDNWYVSGLQGTGSCDFSLTDLFVPEEFTCDVMNDTPRRGLPLYNIRVPGILAVEHAGFALGAGRRALDEISELAQTKSRGIPPSSLIQRTSFQQAIGECDFRLRAARALVIDIYENAWETVSSDEPISLKAQVEMRGAAAYATHVALGVVSEAFQYAGASALYSTNVIQRCYRDLSAAAQHAMVSSTSYENHGKLALGLAGVHPLS